MLNRLFPRQIDNTYEGHVLAIWLLAPIVVLKMMMGFNVSGLNPWVSSRFVLTSADAIPVDTYAPEVASVVVFMFQSWGLALLVLASLGALALLRYRAMLPLMYLALAIEQIGRKAISLVSPIIRAEAASGISFAVVINWALSAALVLGFMLSLMPSRALRASRSGET
jgi:hypothetical protein